MLHSLESVNYLKIDQKNFIEFDFATDKKQIRIVQQFTKQSAAAKGAKTQNKSTEDDFSYVYQIQVHQITLRELLLFQSLYVCSTQSDILELV